MTKVSGRTTDSIHSFVELGMFTGIPFYLNEFISPL